MNDNHSNTEYFYKPRWVQSIIKPSVKSFPITVITGARQVGKSTFLQKEYSDWHYISLDDIDLLSQALEEPESLWVGKEKIIIDEVQRAPKLLNAVKLSVDRTKRQMRFILSGSANLLLLKHITETLAGRAAYFEMLPMAFGEMADIPKPKNFFTLLNGKLPREEVLEKVDPADYMLKGFMPPLLHLKTQREYTLWWESYVVTYLERDLRELSQVESLVDFRKVMKALALRSGNLINQSEIARDTNTSQPTVYRYISLLEVSFLAERLPAFAVNRTKRLIKTPKAYCIDPGLTAFLMGFYDKESLLASREIGSIFETLIFLHLKILSQLTIPKANLYYWRTATGDEVDFVFEYGRKLIAFEAKFAEDIRYREASNLKVFLEEYPETHLGIILYKGSSVKFLHEKIIAMPWWWIVS